MKPTAEAEEGESNNARLDSSDDSSASSKSDSAPPSSSSSSSPPDGGSDGQKPPASPPPADTPPSHPVPLPNNPCPRYTRRSWPPYRSSPTLSRFYKAVVVRNPEVVAAIKEMMKRGQPYLGAFLLKDENTDSDVITDINSVHPVGVFAQITSVFTATGRDDDKEEGLTAVLYPHRRIKITDLVKAGGLAKVQEEDPQTVTPPPSPLLSPSDQQTTGPVQTSFLHKHEISIVNDDQYIRAFMSEIVSVFKDIAQLNPLFRDQITNFSINQVASNVFDEPDKLADFAAAVSTGESLVVDDRLRKALLVLKKELINAQLQSKLSRDVDSKIAKRQREYYLMEQLKERAATLKMPEPVRKVFDEEISKLAGLEPAASEANVTRNYLEWLTQIPWGQHTPENYSIAHAQTDVKDRILEFLAVGKLRGTVEGKIICLVGPPGVGKTSIGKSISRALNRQFFRFSVGGLTDVAEIKGHRRTYVGALPGKIIQALKRVGTENPLVLIDEVDKIGRGHNGDPASALLEMLDPEQNNSFLDHYMDVPVDLSRVLFVCTANNLDTIPAPLLDRMEVLEVSGYVSEEKAAKEASGLKEADVVLEPSAIDVLIKYYCRESGVRNLKKHIDKIYRKAALKLPAPVSTSAADTKTVESQEPSSNEAPASTSTPADPDAPSPTALAEKSTEQTLVTTQKRNPMPIPDSVHVRITPDTLKDYKDRMYVSPPPPGVSTGLGYLGNGSGAVMPVEAMSMPGKGGLQLTGKLGEVIRESAQIGLSWVKSHAFELGITSSSGEQFLNDRDIHVHMPEGSIGKEGPSAGTAILSAFVSLFTKTKINPDIAMTGEISLVGQVLPENVPESVKTGIRFVYVEHVREVLQEVFRGESIAERWKDTL
ncbi:Lon protease C-terminal proteolytic domain-containing protein [Infundibulicybe gibba]|nr:Lon protease C-terminal proteolytic domain-containing protein [Infundibulicybe gibba]